LEVPAIQEKNSNGLTYGQLDRSGYRNKGILIMFFCGIQLSLNRLVSKEPILRTTTFPGFKEPIMVILGGGFSATVSISFYIRRN
jgi:hypothetical protein